MVNALTKLGRFHPLSGSESDLAAVQCFFCFASNMTQLLENLFELLHVLINFRKVANAASPQELNSFMMPLEAFEENE